MSDHGLPETGADPGDLMTRLRTNRHGDAPWREGRIFSLIFPPDDPLLENLLREVSEEYLAMSCVMWTRALVGWCCRSSKSSVSRSVDETSLAQMASGDLPVHLQRLNNAPDAWLPR